MTANPFRNEVIGSLLRPQYQITLSPQCGFASAFEGNMDEDTQRAKLEVLAEASKEIWS